MTLIGLTAQAPMVKDIWNLTDSLAQKNGWMGTSTYLIATLIAVALCIAVPYLLGSINPAILISKIFYREDIRDFGSGNAGTTNMLRTYGKGAAAATFLSDLAKAAISVLFGWVAWGHVGGAIAGLFVILGHMFPVYYKFRGGKGVACLTMVILMISPITFLILLAIYVGLVVLFRYISLASIMCALVYPMLLNAFGRKEYVATAIISAAFVVFMHRENIKRLMDRTESKVNFSKTSKHKKGEAISQTAEETDKENEE